MNIIKNIIDAINNNTPISFSKYGDGEYYCAIQHNSRHNCDGDVYTPKLGEGIRESFKYIINNVDNGYCGDWGEDNGGGLTHNYFNSLVDNKPVKWANFHTFIFDNQQNKCDNQKVEMYKTIKNSKLKKIYICNPKLRRSQQLLNIDHMIYVPNNCWFDSKFEDILKQVIELIGDNDGNHIVMTSCGMSAKVLIVELLKLYPKGIYLDIGSALDMLCGKHPSRSSAMPYNYLTNIMRELLPSNWESL